MLFATVVAIVALLAAGIASIVGFGIGSLLTPTLALETGTKVAVAAVAIPHAVATAQRFWMLRAHVDRRVLLGFGIASAVGGLAGALLYASVSSPALTVVFGIVVAMAGVFELTGWMRRVRWVLATSYREILDAWPLVAAATVAVVIGTAVGTRVLGGIPERAFRRVVAVLLIVLGVYMAVAGGA